MRLGFSVARIQAKWEGSLRAVVCIALSYVPRMTRKVAASTVRYCTGPISPVGCTGSRACTAIPSCQCAAGIPVLGGSGRLHKAAVIDIVYVFDAGL